MAKGIFLIEGRVFKGVNFGVAKMSEKEKKIEDQILENATAPKSVDIDGQKVEQHSLDDQIKAAKFASSAKASRSRGFGIRIGKMKHGGAE